MTTSPRKEIALTGIKPTGVPHIGNYIGAIRPALKLAEHYQGLFLFVADYHALNSISSAKELREDSYGVAATLLAAGLNPEKTVFYRQSDVPELMELAVILTARTPKGLIDRAHAYKAAKDKNRDEGRDDEDYGINMGLYTYPILMTADILSMGGTIVPVGKDQVQHVEIARDIAGYFNNVFGNVFPLPEYRLEKGNSGAILPGLDGRKMSKSYNNHIPLFMDSAPRRKLVMKIVTDSKRPEEPKTPDDNVIFQLYSHFATAEELQTMREAFEKGGMGYGDAKQKLFEVLERTFEEPTARYKDLMAQPKQLDELLAAGAIKARIAARETLSRVRDAIGVKPLVDI